MKSLNLLQKKWYVIDSQTTKGKYKQGDTIKFETETIKSSLCDYSDVFILVTGNIAVTADDNTDVAFKNCAPFSTRTTKINDVFVDEANRSNNYSDTSITLQQFKRDEAPANNNDNLTINNSDSFKYKAALLGKTANDYNGKSSAKDAKVVVPLQYLSNFLRSLNCKVYLELNWIENCILSSARNSAKFNRDNRC